MRLVAEDIYTILTTYPYAKLTFSESVTFQKWETVTVAAGTPDDTGIVVEVGTTYIKIFITQGEFKVNDSFEGSVSGVTAIVDTVVDIVPAIWIQGDDEQDRTDYGRIIIGEYSKNNESLGSESKEVEGRVDMKFSSSGATDRATMRRLIELVEYKFQWENRTPKDSRIISDKEYTLSFLYNTKHLFRESSDNMFIEVLDKWVDT
jgi:hypothetical protein